MTLFETSFGFEAKHVGPIGLTPDVLLLSDEDGWCGIVDNKAYSRYTISNDHRNRMVRNYIGGLGNYYNGVLPLAFFTYIAGGFGKNIDTQIRDIVDFSLAHTISNPACLKPRHIPPMPANMLAAVNLFIADYKIRSERRI